MFKSKLFYVFLILVLAILACGTNTVVSTSEPGTISEGQLAEPQDPQEPQEPKPDTIVAADPIAHNAYLSYDILNIDGLIQNTGNVPVDFVKVIATLRDAGGQLVGSEFTYTSLDVIHPGQTSPFSIGFLEVPPNWVTYEVIVEASEVSLFSISSYTDFEIVSSNGRVGEYTDYEIVGEVKNIGSSTANFVKIAVALYDANGQLLAVDFTFTDLDNLQPDMTSPFSLSILSKAPGDVARYELWVQGSSVE